MEVGIPPPDHSDPPSESLKSAFSVDKSIQANLADTRIVQITNEEGFSFADMLAENSLEKAVQVHLTSSCHHRHKKSEQAASPKALNLAEILSCDSKLYTFIGIPSLDMLDALVECVKDIDVFFTKLRTVISLKNCIVLTVVKIKTNLDFTAIAILFGLTRQTCTTYFHHMCVLLARVITVMIPCSARPRV